MDEWLLHLIIHVQSLWGTAHAQGHKTNALWIYGFMDVQNWDAAQRVDTQAVPT